MKKILIAIAVVAAACGCTTVTTNRNGLPARAEPVPLRIVAIDLQNDKAILQVAGADNVCPDFIQCSESLSGDWKDANPRFRGYRSTETGTIVLMEVDAKAASQFYKTIDRGQPPVQEEARHVVQKPRPGKKPARLCNAGANRLAKAADEPDKIDPPLPTDEPKTVGRKRGEKPLCVLRNWEPDDKKAETAETPGAETPTATVTVREAVLRQPVGDLPGDPIPAKE